MSTFAFGTMKLKNMPNTINLAEQINSYALQLAIPFHIKYGGNADSCFHHMQDFLEGGLHFELTNSVIENTAERIFECFAPVDPNEPDESLQLLEARLSMIQSIFLYAFKTNCVESIRFLIMQDNEAVRADSFELCKKEKFSQNLLVHYHQYHELDKNIYWLLE